MYDVKAFHVQTLSRTNVFRVFRFALTRIALLPPTATRSLLLSLWLPIAAVSFSLPVTPHRRHLPHFPHRRLAPHHPNHFCTPNPSHTPPAPDSLRVKDRNFGSGDVLLCVDALDPRASVQDPQYGEEMWMGFGAAPTCGGNRRGRLGGRQQRGRGRGWASRFRARRGGAEAGVEEGHERVHDRLQFCDLGEIVWPC